jgi:hypothetical protein
MLDITAQRERMVERQIVAREFAMPPSSGRCGLIEGRGRASPFSGLRPDIVAPTGRGGAVSTLLIHDIEAMWAAFAERDDWGPLDAKLDAIEDLRSVSDRLV